MKNTVKCLIESSVTPEFDFITENTASLNILKPLTEAEKMSTSFTPQKVMVLKSPENGYLVEYANNLERLMYDQDMGIVESMTVVAEANDIALEDCTVVFDESCINRIDIGAVIKLDPEFELAKK